MATILDVAKEAGVSQGTVSNVLNKKGNVSAEKIQAVEEAARRLGFTINERAKMLRKGSTDLLSVILPNLECSQYREFYNSFKLNAKKQNYSTEILISNDNPGTELELIQKAKSGMASGVVSISCLWKDDNPYQRAGIENVVFVERRPRFEAEYFGFDYKKAGEDLAEQILTKKIMNVALVTASEKFSNEREFAEAFKTRLDQNADCQVTHVVTDSFRIAHTILNIFTSASKVDAIVTTNMGFAVKISEIQKSMFSREKFDIFTLSPVYSLPETEFIKYELNYSLLGKETANRIIQKKCAEHTSHCFANDGICVWNNFMIRAKSAKRLNLLTLEGPEALAMKGLASLYTEKTGTDVKIAVFSYDEVYEQLKSANDLQLFDIFRIDVTWLSWFADKILYPLDEIDPGIGEIFREYIPGLDKKYALINGKIYALPTSPSAQMLFYRKDLFEEPAIQSLYKKRFGQKLDVPKDFKEFNQIAKFFTGFQAGTLEQSIKYGTTLTWGNTGVAATEFLCRYFSHKHHLYDSNGKIVLNDEVGKITLRELMDVIDCTDRSQTSWWTTSAKMFANGETAMSIMFTNYASEILGSGSKIIDKIGFSMVPGGNPLLGGGTLTVAKTTKYPEDALEFIKWITREPAASAIAALGGVSPCVKTYEKYNIINTFPWLELSRECFGVSKTKRPPEGMDKPFEERRFLKILGTAVKSAAQGLITEDQALRQAQTAIERELN